MPPNPHLDCIQNIDYGNYISSKNTPSGVRVRCFSMAICPSVEVSCFSRACSPCCAAEITCCCVPRVVCNWTLSARQLRYAKYPATANTHPSSSAIAPTPNTCPMGGPSMRLGVLVMPGAVTRFDTDWCGPALARNNSRFRRRSKAAELSPGRRPPGRVSSPIPRSPIPARFPDRTIPAENFR